MCVSCTLCVVTENFTRETILEEKKTTEFTIIAGFCTIKQVVSYNHIESKEQLLTDIVTHCSHYIKN